MYLSSLQSLCLFLKCLKNSRLKFHRRTENKTNFLNCQSETGSHNISTSELFFFFENWWKPPRVERRNQSADVHVQCHRSETNRKGQSVTVMDSQWHSECIVQPLCYLYSFCSTWRHGQCGCWRHLHLLHLCFRTKFFYCWYLHFSAPETQKHLWFSEWEVTPI